jgi:hypothetical protein
VKDLRLFPVGGLGRARYSLAFFVLGVGVLSFFVPLVTTDPRVLGKTLWSPLNIAWQIAEGNLPNPATGGAAYLPTDTISVYLLILLTLAALLFFPHPKALATIGLVGTLVSYHARHWDLYHFRWMFYGQTWADGNSAGRVDFSRLVSWLLVVMAALFLIALDAILDPPELPQRTTPNGSCNSPQPEFLEAEIQPSKESKPNRPFLDDKR